MSTFKVSFGLSLAVVFLFGGPLNSLASTLAYISPEQFINSFAGEESGDIATGTEPDKSGSEDIPVPSMEGTEESKPEVENVPFQGNIPIPSLGGTNRGSGVRDPASAEATAGRQGSEQTQRNTNSSTNTTTSRTSTTTSTSRTTNNAGINRVTAEETRTTKAQPTQRVVPATSNTNEQQANELTNNEVVSTNQVTAEPIEEPVANELTNNVPTNNDVPEELHAAPSTPSAPSVPPTPIVPPSPIQASITQPSYHTPPPVQTHQMYQQQYPYYSTTNVRGSSLPDSGMGTVVGGLIAGIAGAAVLFRRKQLAYEM